MRRTILCDCGEFPEGEDGHGCMECGEKYRTYPTILDTFASIVKPGRWGWFWIGWFASSAVWIAIRLVVGA